MTFLYFKLSSIIYPKSKSLSNFFLEKTISKRKVFLFYPLALNYFMASASYVYPFKKEVNIKKF